MLRSGVCSRILIVDDEGLVLKACERELESVGHYVRTALNGQQALNIVGQESFDIVFTDLVMPEMNGVDVCYAIKRVAPETEVVLMTGHPTEVVEHLAAFLNAGGRDLMLRKPLTEDELTRAAETVLKERQTNREHYDPS